MRRTRNSTEEGSTAEGEAIMTRRPCCIGGKRHMVLGRRRYAYMVSKVTQHSGIAEKETVGYHLVRVPRVEDGQKAKDAYDSLCIAGHWAKLDSLPLHWEFQSPRAADDMARRLNAGLPVHRDRWLGIGAVLLLAFEAVQAFRWW